MGMVGLHKLVHRASYCGELDVEVKWVEKSMFGRNEGLALTSPRLLKYINSKTINTRLLSHLIISTKNGLRSVPLLGSKSSLSLCVICHWGTGFDSKIDSRYGPYK